MRHDMIWMHDVLLQFLEHYVMASASAASASASALAALVALAMGLALHRILYHSLRGIQTILQQSPGNMGA